MSAPVPSPASPVAPRPKMSKHDAGVLGMQRRWGVHGRILRLDKLDPATKELVCLILDAAKAKREADAAAGETVGQP